MEGRGLIFLILATLCGLTIAQNNPCYDKWWGEYVANPNNCRAYYVCILTIPNLRYCEDGKVFDESLRTCVPGDVETCEIYGSTTTPHPETETPSTTTEEPTTTTTEEPTTTTTEPPTTTTSRTTTHPPTTSTTRTTRTTRTTTPRTSRTTTPRTTRTRTTRTTTTRTTTSSTTPSTTTTTTTEPTTISPPNIDEICYGVFFGARKLSDEEDKLYVGCIRGYGGIYTCYPDEYFDSQINECVVIV